MNTGLIAVHKVMNEVKKVIVGKDIIVRKVMVCILAKGHILIDDIPGVGKTTLAMAFSKAMSLQQNRIQFTPDVMPSDVTGFNIFNQRTKEFEYKQGAVVCNILLADEINRTSSKTQSALLEAMEERKITVDGQVYELPEPFIVIATQNPVGSIGTHMLPESQLDRFAMRLTMGYPALHDEVAMMKGKHNAIPMDDVEAVLNGKMLMQMQDEVQKVFIHDDIYNYIARIAQATREHESIELGISPRGSIVLCNLAKANAYMNDRNYVIPDDIRAVLMDVVGHRIILTSRAKAGHETVESIMHGIVGKIVV